MNPETKQAVKDVIVNSIDAKIKKYKRESDHVPFFDPFVTQSMIRTHSIMQSLYTTFGMSVYEQVAVVLAKAAGYEAIRQYDLLGEIDTATGTLISQLLKSTPGNKIREIEEIRSSILPGQPLEDADKRVDVYILKPDGTEIYVDITTVKGNLKEYRKLRDKMLKWAGLRLSQKPDAKVSTHIGLPYNPYHPQPYIRWTSAGNDPSEVLVQNDLWQLFAGYDVFDELVSVFQEVGPLVRERLIQFVETTSKQ